MEILRNIGIDIKPPSKTCNDPECPFHGSLSVRGKILEGKVVNNLAKKMVVIEREYLHYVKKYMRYERRRSKIHAHLPPCIEVTKGDKVMIGECRPLAKTVSFVVLGKVES
ncbi:MAG: 30S ribosomal protein S17 [Nitrososphaerales archaeon]